MRALRRRESVISDIDREVRLHVELQTDANIRAGMTPAQARTAAMHSFGNVNRAVDAAYDVKGGGFLETITQDMRLLFGVTAFDLPTFTTISLLLVFVSLLACYLPARRATRIDPLRALRYE